MTETLVIDASIAVKWLVQEPGTEAALSLRGRFSFVAPELLVAECANVLWKKTARGEMTDTEALIAAQALQAADIELQSMPPLLVPATRLSIQLGHPAYDCMYLAQAIELNVRYATADTRFVDKARQWQGGVYADLCVTLERAAAPI